MSNSPDDILYSPISSDETKLPEPANGVSGGNLGDCTVTVTNGGSTLVSHGVDADPEWINYVTKTAVESPVQPLDVTWQCNIQETIVCNIPATTAMWVPMNGTTEYRQPNVVIVYDEIHRYIPFNGGEVKSNEHC